MQKQKGDGLLVSIQERGALLVPLMNRVVEHEKLPNRGNITASETRVENRQVQNANTSRALARACVRRTAQSARRRGVPVARRETH